MSDNTGFVSQPSLSHVLWAKQMLQEYKMNSVKLIFWINETFKINWTLSYDF